MALLQTHSSSLPTIKTDGGEKNAIVADNNALLPSTSLFGAMGGTVDQELFSDEISVYVVRNGDSISQIAKMFDVSVDTILSVNEMKKNDKLKEGDVLLILPFSGVEHTVTKGQTLQGIANLYKVNINEILLANDINSGEKLIVGEKLMIPGAGMLSETTKPKPNTSTNSTYAKMPSVIGYFKNPLPGARRSRGMSSTHKGVDLAAPTGTPIYAAASGKVLTARMGWNGAFGNMVILQHANGAKTLYAHMSKLGTSTGAQVTQGEVIGYVGSTGRSTGPHLHLEVLGAKNPF